MKQTQFENNTTNNLKMNSIFYSNKTMVEFWQEFNASVGKPQKLAGLFNKIIITSENIIAKRLGNRKRTIEFKRARKAKQLNRLNNQHNQQ